jgi:hypothetical protein
VARNAVKPDDLSEIRGGVRNMGTLRYCTCMMNADAKGEREPEVLILDRGADSLHLRLGHVEPLLGVLLRRQEGDQVQRSQSCLSPETEFLDINLTKDLTLLLHAIHSPFYWRILMKHTLF